MKHNKIKTSHIRKWFILMVGLPLVIGALFYYLFCPDVYFVSLLDKITGLNIHVPLFLSNNSFIFLLRNYLLDFIWAFAFANMLYLIIYRNKRLRFLIVFMPLLAGIVLEIMQKFNIISGTFDVIDIVIEATATIVSNFIILLKTGGNNEKI